MEEMILKSKDQLKLEIVHKTYSGELDRAEACQALKVSKRTLRRYISNYREKGISFLVHGNKKREPVNKTQKVFKKKVQNLIIEKYFDFNVCHLQEKLEEELGMKLTYSTLYRWCTEMKMVKNKHKKRRSKPRKHRNRMTQSGYMLQLDGSHHHWFGGRFLCLMAAIDDATGEVFAKFYEGETSWACMDFLKDLIKKKGVPKFIYTDRAGVYGRIKREHFSQVERALGELGSHVIYAQSPEGKGRVERLFKTLQDRLVAELRLEGINKIPSANKYLKNIYLPQQHNIKFTVKAENHISAYKAIPFEMSLDEVFCMKEYRIIGRDHTVSIKGSKWLIADDLKYSIAKARIELRFNKWGEWKSFFANKPIKLIKIKKAKRLAG
jgi:transposase-like protein